MLLWTALMLAVNRGGSSRGPGGRGSKKQNRHTEVKCPVCFKVFGSEPSMADHLQQQAGCGTSVLPCHAWQEGQEQRGGSLSVAAAAPAAAALPMVHRLRLAWAANVPSRPECAGQKSARGFYRGATARARRSLCFRQLRCDNAEETRLPEVRKAPRAARQAQHILLA